jgi:hypothetical protein
VNGDPGPSPPRCCGAAGCGSGYQSVGRVGSSVSIVPPNATRPVRSLQTMRSSVRGSAGSHGTILAWDGARPTSWCAVRAGW